MKKYNQEEDWAEIVVHNLRRIFERMDDRETAKINLRDDLKDFLQNFDPEKHEFEYGRVLDLVEAFFMAIPTAMFELADDVVYRIIIARDALKSKNIKPERKIRIKSKLHEWIQLAVYELQKIQIPAVESREHKIQNSALGIMGRDVISLYDRGPSRDVNKQVQQDKNDQESKDDSDDDNRKQPQVY